MWYVPRHKRSWWKQHALDIGTAIGLIAFFGTPVWIWMLGLA